MALVISSHLPLLVFNSKYLSLYLPHPPPSSLPSPGAAGRVAGAEGLREPGQYAVSLLFLPVEPASTASKAQFTLRGGRHAGHSADAMGGFVTILVQVGNTGTAGGKVLLLRWQGDSCTAWGIFITRGVLAACKIFVSRSGMNPRPLQWNHGILTTGPPGKSRSPSFLHAGVSSRVEIHNPLPAQCLVHHWCTVKLCSVNERMNEDVQHCANWWRARIKPRGFSKSLKAWMGREDKPGADSLQQC